MLNIPDHLKSVVNRDGAVILDTPRNSMTPLNSTGGFVWERLQRGIPLDDVITELSHETSTDRSIVDADVRRFLEELQSRNLVVAS